MPTKKPQNSPAVRTFGSAKFDRYIHVEIPHDTTPEMVATWAAENGVTVENAIAYFYGNGYRITFKANGLDADLCEVSAYDTVDDSPTAGQILTASADTITLATSLLLYKHMVLLEGNWGGALAEKRTKRRLM